MSCSLCEQVHEIKDTNGTIVFSSMVTELIIKIRKYLNLNEFTYEIEDSFTLTLEIKNFREFITNICNTKEFSKLEREAINILFIEDLEVLNPKHLKDLMSLEKYKHKLKSVYLSKLIKNESLTVHFQPILDANTDAIIGYEALSRGFDEEGNLIEPSKLIQWAKQGDMISLLDKNLRVNALKAAAVAQIDTLLFINFIPSAIYDPEHCLRTTVQWVKDLGINSKNLVFEVIESDYVEDIPHLKNILGFYKKQGYMVALDDVGSGTASMQMIMELKPDIIKIDRSIISNIHTELSKQSIFSSIVKLGKDLDIKVLAEGIETKEEAEYCKSTGIDMVQGFHYARPSSEITKKL